MIVITRGTVDRMKELREQIVFWQDKLKFLPKSDAKGRLEASREHRKCVDALDEIENGIRNDFQKEIERKKGEMEKEETKPQTQEVKVRFVVEGKIYVRATTKDDANAVIEEYSPKNLFNVKLKNKDKRIVGYSLTSKPLTPYWHSNDKE